MLLSSLLLPVLIVPFIMNQRLSPEETPYWLFGLIFLVLLLNLLCDVVFNSRSWYEKTKYFLLWFLVVSVLGSAFFSVIVVRHKVAPIYTVHDSVLQTEAAVRFIRVGKNPYATSYFGTPLQAWNYSQTETNPALYSFVYLPFNLLLSLPFYYISNHTIGYFDARIPLFVFTFIALIFVFLLEKGFEKRLLFITLLAFNPALLSYTLEGRSDMLVVSFLFLTFCFFSWKRKLLGAFFLGLSLALKQSVWPIFPFYIAYLYFKTRSKKAVIVYGLLSTITFLGTVLPFFLWDPAAFVSSTIYYLSGNTAHSYPVSGYGFGMLLKQLGVIQNVHAYYPFWIWQLIFCAPLIVFLIMFLKKVKSVPALIFSYGIFLFVYWYFSRYFNNSHLGYLSMIFILAYFWPPDKEHTVLTKKTNTNK